MRHKHSHQSDPNTFKTSHGSKEHIIRGSRVNPDGTITLYESSRENIKDKINSHLAETDMSIIIARLKNGDTSVLSANRPIYADFTQFPKTYAEAFDLVQRSESAFENLPVNIKQSFDNNVALWFSSIGSPEWIDKMGFNPSSDAPSSGGDADE